MRKHNGMRPQDVVVLLKIWAKQGNDWTMKEIAGELYMSASEVTEAMHRNLACGLVLSNKREVQKTELLDFLKYGLKYVFPAQISNLGKGIPTAYSSPVLHKQLHNSEKIVWGYAKGKERGLLLEPLIPSLPQACLLDEAFYDLASLAETFRIGKPREIQIVYDELRKRI